MLDTDQLRSFVSIVDTGSFTRAAERVNKTQSAVSMHIKRLEEQLGRALFLKQGRGVRLSDDGEKLIDYARQMLQIEAAAFASVSRKALAGRIRLGIPDDYAESFLPQILTRFICRHPLVELSVVCESSSVLAERDRGPRARHGGRHQLHGPEGRRGAARRAAALGGGRDLPRP